MLFSDLLSTVICSRAIVFIVGTFDQLSVQGGFSLSVALLLTIVVCRIAFTKLLVKLGGGGQGTSSGSLRLVAIAMTAGLMLLGLTAQAQAQVTSAVDGDRPGGDFLSFALPADNAELCRVACQRFARCKAYTFQPARRGANARCWLKETVPDLVATAPFKSGVRTGPSIEPEPLEVAAPEDFTLETADRPGGDLRSETLPASASSTDCQTLCRGDSRCRAYTFTNRDGIKTCFLKDRATPLSACAYCISGRKIGNPEIPLSELAFGNNVTRSIDPVRPLLVLILNVPPGIRDCRKGTVPTEYKKEVYHVGQTVDYWRRFFFGPAEPNIASYFYRASGGGFSFVEAGVVGPLDIPCVPKGENRPFMLGLALRSGFDFGRFDRNGDGTVSNDELSVLAIDNVTRGGAQSIASVSILGDGISVNPYYSAVGHRSRFWNFAHELAHVIPQFDVYGATSLGACNGGNLTLASCTAGGSASVAGSQQFVSVYPDGYHRMFWGWTKPLIVSMEGEGGCYKLTAVPDRRSNPVVLFSPSRGLSKGLSEYFLIEHRSRLLSEFSDEAGSKINLKDLDGAVVGSAGSYDKDFAKTYSGAPDAGALVWWIKIDPSGPRSGPWNRPIRIVDGAGPPDLNKRLESKVLLDDVLLRVFSTDGTFRPAAILPGPNGIVDSTPAGDDIYLHDGSLISTANPLATLPAPFVAARRSAPSPVLLANSRPQQLKWLDGADAPMTIRAGPVVSNPGAPSTVEIEWGLVPLAIEMTDALRVRAGSTLRLRGLFGASNFGADRRVELRSRDTSSAPRIPLSTRFWSCAEVEVDVPKSAMPGNYQLHVVGLPGEPVAPTPITIE